METLIEDTDMYARIDEVLDPEFVDFTPPPPALPKSFSVCSSHSSSVSGSPGRVRSDSLFTRSHNPRPVSILDDTCGQMLRDIPHKVDNTRGHALLSIKFAESVSDFFKKLSELNENYSKSLHGLVKQFIAKNNDIKREKYFCAASLFSYWESLVGEVEQQSLAYQEFAHTLKERISLPLRMFATQKKDLLKKVFQTREEFAFDLSRQKDENQRLYKEYSENHSKMISPNIKPILKESLTLQCHNSHNDYVLQLAASNAFSVSYHKTQLLTLLDCVEDVLHSMSDEFKSSLNYYISQSNTMLRKIVGRFDTLAEVMSNVSFSRDISHFAKLQNSSKIPDPIRFSFQDPDINLNPGESVMSEHLISTRQTQQALSHRSNEVRQKKLSVTRQICNLTKEYDSIRKLYKQYDQSPEYGNKDDIEGVLLSKKLELTTAECGLATLEGKTDLFDMLDMSCISLDTNSLPLAHQGQPDQIERLHQLISFNYKKFKRCDYCNEQLSMIKNELKCEVCYMRLHKKCQNNISYCTGVPIREKEVTVKQSMKRETSINNNTISNISRDNHTDDSDDEHYERVPSVEPVTDETYNSPDPSNIPMSISSFQDAEEGLTPTNLQPDVSIEQLDEIFEPLSVTTPVRDESINTDTPIGKPKLCVTLFDYTGQDTQDLSFNKGEVLELRNWTDRDWWQATLKGKTGFVPFNYVHALEENEEVYIALYDFNPQTQEEIKLKLGQVVFVNRNEGDGWLHGTDGTERGIFPATYVEKYDPKKKVKSEDIC